MVKIGVIFGGISGEHDISLMSAASILRAMDKNKYEPIPIGIDRDGSWRLAEPDFDAIEKGKWVETSKAFNITKLKKTVDFVFPVIHGTQGEDGALQGLLELLDVPFAGGGVLASAVCMDKATTKDVLSKHGLPVCRYKVVSGEDIEHNMANIVKEISKEFTGSIFVKPANEGSSLGISKVDDMMDIGKALSLAGSYDRRILVEEAIKGREVEVGVIGNEKPMASLPGEITTNKIFDYYDYEAKYSDSSGTRLDIPADLPEDVTERVRELAVRAYQATDCAGFSRVDFFIEHDTGEVLVNEINTIPGFTGISMYPVLMTKDGLSLKELMQRLLDTAFARREH